MHTLAFKNPINLKCYILSVMYYQGQGFPLRVLPSATLPCPRNPLPHDDDNKKNTKSKCNMLLDVLCSLIQTTSRFEIAVLAHGFDFLGVIWIQTCDLETDITLPSQIVCNHNFKRPIAPME